MKYLCLIYGDESDPASNPAPDDPAMAAMMAGYEAFSADHEDRILAGEALVDTPYATSVRVRDGETITTDGPFAETLEQLGGFYMIEADDLDQAIAVAARIPHAALGTIEVRPVMTFE